MPRRNGWQRPWHPQQVATWVGFLAYVAAFYKSICPHVASNLALFCQIGYGIISLATAVSALFVTIIDPVDRAAAKEREARVQSRVYDLSDFPRICHICVIHTSKSTKHCGYCRKCVADFDHHCHWVNNCVAGRNYVLFIVLVCCLQVQISWFVGLGGAIIGELLGSGEPGKQTEASILLALLFIGSAVFLLNGVLILFHIYLRCKGISTFTFMKKRRPKAAVQPALQLDNSKLSMRMSQDASLSQDQQSSDLPTFHPDSQQVQQFSVCRQPAEEFILPS